MDKRTMKTWPHLDILLAFGRPQHDLVIGAEALTVEQSEEDDLEAEELGDVREHLEAEVERQLLAAATLLVSILFKQFRPSFTDII
jgi:hypothetical protein